MSDGKKMKAFVAKAAIVEKLKGGLIGNKG